MNLTETYRDHRRVAVELTNKILKTSVKPSALGRSAKLLGIGKGRYLIFDSESEMDALMDFVINEYRVNNQNAVELYLAQQGAENEIEEEILNAFVSSYTSLFKIVSVSRREHLVVLSDLLNKRDNVQLMDINLSGTAVPGLLIFLRVLQLKQFAMTSGMSFAFPGELEEYLLARYKRLKGTVRSRHGSARRFVCFHRLSRSDGLKVGYRRIDSH